MDSAPEMEGNSPKRRKGGEERLKWGERAGTDGGKMSWNGVLS